MTRTLTGMTSWAGEEWGSGFWSFFTAWGTRLDRGAFSGHRPQCLVISDSLWLLWHE